MHAHHCVLLGQQCGQTEVEGLVHNTLNSVWEELDGTEKELLMGHLVGDTKAPCVSEGHRAVRLGRAMDGHTIRLLGALLHARQS